MPPVDPVELAPLIHCQRSEEQVVQDFRPGAEPALALVQDRDHFLKLSLHRLPRFFRRHSLRYQAFRRIVRHWRAHLPAGVTLEVPYEQLVQDHEQWSRRMLEFLDLPWDPHCLQFFR